MKYVVVQRTGFVPYFLCAWRDGAESWACLRDRALTFTGPAARKIVAQLNARRPFALVPVACEVVR